MKNMERNVEMAINKMVLPPELWDIVKHSDVEVIIPETREELLELSLGIRKGHADSRPTDNLRFDVEYTVEGRDEPVKEAWVTKCKNGVVANFYEPYMRRRDPDSMIIADDLLTDKTTHEELIGEPFEDIREKTFKWFKEQKTLILMPFYSGNKDMGVGYPSVLLAPVNAAFFAASLADLQGFVPLSQIPNYFRSMAVIYVAPPFRHLYYNGKQYVVHNRTFGLHEVFSYNLYPGPSAKKGVFSVLINIGEQEQKPWITAHASTVKVITPYELTIVVMHEGASGGGKSEMHVDIQRERDGRVKLAENIVTREEVLITMSDACELLPVTDDMALCHPSFMSDGSKKLVVSDAEDGWFLRVDHIGEYGTDYNIERSTIHPREPLIFLNMDAIPGSTCLIWEPIVDEAAEGKPAKKCPNPRVIFPRKFIKGIVEKPVAVDIRSFGLRQPPSTRDNPNYGIAGLYHVLPPALAWLWRLVSPRGYANPSILGGDGKEMESEGIGSYWPFATGKMVDQANLMLEQILETPSTRFILIPNQFIGAYKVGFAGQWVTREYLARRGGSRYSEANFMPSRCPLLGYSPEAVKIDGNYIPKTLLKTHLQPELGEDGYDRGAEILTEFFKKELKKYLKLGGLKPLGTRIVEACLNGASVRNYYDFIPKL